MAALDERCVQLGQPMVITRPKLRDEQTRDYSNFTETSHPAVTVFFYYVSKFRDRSVDSNGLATAVLALARISFLLKAAAEAWLSIKGNKWCENERSDTREMFFFMIGWGRPEEPEARMAATSVMQCAKRAWRFAHEQECRFLPSDVVSLVDWFIQLFKLSDG
jgi:hypothetical protein